jgi:hypothetical protein
MYKKRAVRDKNGKLIYQVGRCAAAAAAREPGGAPARRDGARSHGCLARAHAPPPPRPRRAQEYQSRDLPTTRIQPDRRWFGNTRVIGQKQLEQFRTEMSAKVNDAYTVLLREKKLPLQLLEDPDKKRSGKEQRVKVLNSFSFGDTFGPNRKRKRPKLAVDSLDELAESAEKKEETFGARPVHAPLTLADELKDMVRDTLFEKGQSRRIWGELYKVLDSSDVVIQVRGRGRRWPAPQPLRRRRSRRHPASRARPGLTPTPPAPRAPQVLDARDPEGTRCRFLEHHIRTNARHKHLLFLLNKCDLVGGLPSRPRPAFLHWRVGGRRQPRLGPAPARRQHHARCIAQRALRRRIALHGPCRVVDDWRIALNQNLLDELNSGISLA